jgi:copper chaperone NosL
MKFPARAAVAISSLLLAGLFALPLWHVRLTAPQYPEGLGMYIRVNTVQGATETDLANINKLNHYIGMKPIDPGTIPELRFMPWIVGALVVIGLIAAISGKKKLLYGWTSLLVLFAIVGLIDFWRWEYDYGHNLSPSAIIKIPGMTYQPPLIGAKQLLNFKAVSVPAAGGILAGIALVLAAVAVLLTLRQKNVEPAAA